MKGVIAIMVAATLAALPWLGSAGCRTGGNRNGAVAVIPGPATEARPVSVPGPAPEPRSERRPVAEAEAEAAEYDRAGRETARIEPDELPSVDEDMPDDEPDTSMHLDEGKMGKRPAKGVHHRVTGAQGAKVVPEAGARAPGSVVTTPPPASQDSVSSVDKALASLDWGTIAFDVPSEMRYQEHRIAELVLSPRASQAELESQLADRTSAQSAKIRVSAEMEAELIGTGIAVRPLDHASQLISRDKITRWQWELIAEKPGAGVLQLKLYVHIKIAGSEKVHKLESFVRTIHVKITPWQVLADFFGDNWQWLWSVLLVPVAGYLWQRRRHHGGPPSVSLPV